MTSFALALRVLSRASTRFGKTFAMAVGLVTLASCAGQYGTPESMAAAAPMPTTPTTTATSTLMSPAPLQVTPPDPDPRVGLAAGLFDAAEASWNMRIVSNTPPVEQFVGVTNSDLAFSGEYAIQGNYNGFQIWNIEDASNPASTTTHLCPASQSDVSVYGNLLFVSGEGLGGRIDCGTQGVAEAVSGERLRGIRIFDISDVRSPRYIHNVQTCRGSHTHTVLEAPNDPDNVYIYVSGSSGVRPAEELEGCSNTLPSEDPNSSLFRIEVIKVPLANPEQAAIVSSPRIFNELVAPPSHGLSAADIAELDAARAAGAFIGSFGPGGAERVLPSRMTQPMLDEIVAARGGSGAATAADSASLRERLPEMMARNARAPRPGAGQNLGPSQCHDITVYPGMGLAGGACGGYGLLLDISDPTDPRRLMAAADSNFAYWHSATFNNDGTKVIFTDEWGGGGGPKCRASDPVEWGADAIFTIEGDELVFQSYYKLPAAQTSFENCVAHNGSLVPVPGRDIMAQAWYQGGISVFDWTDPKNPVEIAFHDRGPTDGERMGSGGSWSVYWYNGVLVSSEIARGLDIFELLPSEVLSQNEIDAALSVRLEQLNAQGQPKFEWPYTFALARAYVDQLERSRSMTPARVTSARATLDSAERASGAARGSALRSLAREIAAAADQSADPVKTRMLAEAVRGLSDS
jgi:hypothetical protein